MKSQFETPELSVEELSHALYQANLKLEIANQQLRQAQQERSIFFNNISHDLRSPVSALKSCIEYLLTLDSYEQEDMAQLFHVIQSRILLLEHLIEDLFYLSDVECSELKMNYEEVNIGMFLEEFFFSCETDKKYQDRTLILKVPSDFPYLVRIDCQMIVRVLDNLFTNALKYSNANDSIMLDALYRDNAVCIAVTDTGIGISKEHLDKIFQRTYMVKNSRTPDNNNGNGLGLAIAKTIIQRHNGRIWCESTPSMGSTFYFQIPIINTIESLGKSI